MESSQVYIEVAFSNIDEERKEILIALLSEAGYEGFVEEENSLQAYVPSTIFEKNRPEKLLGNQFAAYKTRTVPQKNWNSIWESSFEPVLIADEVAIRADFHAPVKNARFEIVITPKMSFGTGHHATTSLMVEEMLNHDLNGKSVLDFGTGTGILAILAEKLGAENILAIDCDPWSINNARENVENNVCRRITIQQQDTISDTGKYDFILANINKNVILSMHDELLKTLAFQGVLLISGLLATDLSDIMGVFQPFLGTPKQLREKNNWVCLTFKNERIED